MSVHKRTLPSGRAVWSVRWRESERNRARDFDTKRDAEAFDAELRRRRRLGEPELLDAGRETLADFAREWWSVYAEPNLARKTRKVYADLWGRHVLCRLGGAELRRITPEVVESFQAELRKAGVGDPTILKTLALLQGILQRAVVWRRIQSNPVAAIKKPSQRRKRVVRPIAPQTVEALRESLLARRRLGDAALVSVLAYAGLRPGEALALQWRDVQERTLIVERAVALGDLKETKTGQTRSVRLLAPLAADLAEWRLACGRPADFELVFQTRAGRLWADHDWRNWRKRIFTPAAEAAGLGGFRPYDLRHSFVSLLLAEGRSVLEVAKQAGHSPTMALATYGHVIEELEGAEKLPAEEVIRRAREELVRTTFARERKRPSTNSRESLQILKSPLTDSNRRPPPYHATLGAIGGNRWQRDLACRGGFWA
ncbi:MAG: site-specific integrase [Actinomycetota bacterium]|nr:site-specific integrase [Actinomycetota bacterium]